MKSHLLTICIILSSCLCITNSHAQTLTYRQINEEILFAPEFEAYKYGRRTDENGVGKAWFERFRILHISDIHQCNENLAEALEVAAPRMHAVLNTGDDANGVRSSDAGTVKKELDASIGAVLKTNTIPFMQVPGNHDVTGLTKKEYFDKIGSAVSRFCPEVVWGDKAGYRSYGYMDFTEASYNGNFRIIMLDPFDYDDGMFETKYQFISAVFSQKQIDWFIETLTDAAVKGLHVITMMHYSFGDNPIFDEKTANPDATFCQDPFMIPDIIDAVQHKGKLSRTYEDKAGIHDVRVDCDFSDVPELDFIVHLFGHIHSKNDYQCQRSDGKKYDMLMLGESSIGISGTALNKKHVERGTMAGIAFSALEIDVFEKAIYRVSYGVYLNYDKSDSERTTKIPYRFN